MIRRTLIRSLKLPFDADSRALAESLTENFNVASISGSNDEYEVQFVSPDELIAVVSPGRARFYLEPHDRDDEDEADEEAEEEDPYEAAEMICHFLARRVGSSRDEESAKAKQDDTPDDEADEIARRVIARLLEENLLELVTPRSRMSVEKHLAHVLAHGGPNTNLCDEIADVRGVAELYTSDEQLAEIVAACRRKRPAAQPPSIVEKLRAVLNARPEEMPRPKVVDASARASAPSKQSGEGSARASAASKQSGEGSARTSAPSKQSGEGSVRASAPSKQSGEGKSPRKVKK